MRYPTHATRIRWLRSLLELVEDNEDRIASAISADFGHRSRFEIGLTEIFVSVVEIKHAVKHLKSWMRPERVPTPMHLRPGRARIERQPIGVVGIISPWNYPLLLSIPPAVGALAAGNRVICRRNSGPGGGHYGKCAIDVQFPTEYRWFDVEGDVRHDRNDRVFLQNRKSGHTSE
jgi:acyl-CoA reductase-like NAD-dependent aldehyde dehydrogenase